MLDTLCKVKTIAGVLSLLGNVIVADISDSLSHYETMHINDVNHQIVKRSLDGPWHMKKLDFSTLGRHFRVYLQPDSHVLAQDFKAYARKGDGTKEQFGIDPGNFYKGHVSGETHSEVHAYWEDNAISATIKTPEDTYVIEPSWGHLPQSPNYTMITYKGSDVKSLFDKNQTNGFKKKYCEFVRPPGSAETSSKSNDTGTEKDDVHSREKRAFIPLKNTCPLGLTADYRFFENMGKKNLVHTTNYLIGLISRVDALYRRVEFDASYKNFGFEIKEITVHTEPEKVAPGDVHYNMEKAWETKDLLKAFSKGEQYKTFCLHHLFTFYAFEGGVLGLAYIASPRRYSVGGICSSSYYEDGETFSLNSGWSSGKNRYGNRILTSEADLVSAHELGHNWGSEHDPEGDCSPSAFKGGKYIMFPYSVSGYEANNKHFSPCSRRNIAAVLRSKSNQCFSQYIPGKAFCGNNKIETGEECDGGIAGQQDQDPCCDSECKLRSGATCSDSNHVCCQNCKLAPRGFICNEASPLGEGITCTGNAECNGTSVECPEPNPKPDYTRCVDFGSCFKGVCRPFCKVIGQGYEPCACDTVEQSCQICCMQKNTNASCAPKMNREGKYMNLSNGRPCVFGYCEEGVCRVQVEDMIQRFWNIIEDLSIDTVVKFMRDNLVGTILVLSVILWIPASCVFSHFDKKRQKEEENIVDWHSGKNAGLIPARDRNKIRIRNVTNNV
ncbi:ADAM 17-like protease isoform X2 [Lineus longissimus]|uniref:ADAM 17-like protease isoform X2 n=1 Tax=Lineus longissimus TaxID=88925 RepID=UPI00315CB7E0